MSNQEKITDNREHAVSADSELESIADQQREAIKNTLEKHEKERHENLEEVKNEALEKAASKHEKKNEHEKATKVEKLAPEPRGHGRISKKQKDATLKKTLKTVQSELPLPSRAFSKLIHNRVIEKTSDVVGATVARPNAILAGSATAFVFTLTIFLVARYYGYPLSGSETIAGFVVGWATGVLFDYLRVMISGKTS